MKIFGKELKPEINNLTYWIHLVLIVLIVYYLVNYFIQPMDITFDIVWKGTLILAISDILSHSILQLD